jgi:hypothetical protein
VVTVFAEEGGPYGHREETHHAQDGRAKGGRDAKAPGRQVRGHPSTESHRPQEGGNHASADHDTPEGDGPEDRPAEVSGSQEHREAEDHLEAEDHRPEDHRPEDHREAEDDHPEAGYPQGGGEEVGDPKDHPPEDDGSEDHGEAEDRRDQEEDHSPEGARPEADHNPEADHGSSARDDTGRTGHHPAHGTAPCRAGSDPGAEPVGRRRGDPPARRVAVVVGFGRGAARHLGPLRRGS